MRRILLVVALLVGGLVAFDYLAPHQAARAGLALELNRVGLAPKETSIQGFEAIKYLEGGPADGEPLVLIHGFGASGDNFIRVAAPLTKQYHVIVPDLPGFGESSKPDTVTYTIPEQVERVRAFVAKLGLKKVHLGGSSMGGFIVTQYAVSYPDEVGSLWLLGPAGTEKAFDSELRKMIEASGGEIPLLAKTPEEFPKIMDLTMSKQAFVPHSVKQVLGERAAANYELHKKIFDQIKPPASPSLDGQINGLATPTLVVWGKEDRALNYEASETYKAKMPNVQVVLMDGIGHLPMIEDAKQSAKDYLAFRASLKN